MKNKLIIRLDGCQVTKLKSGSDGTFESALIKLGNLLYMPLGKGDIWRLEEHDSGISLFEGLETHKNYTLDLSGMDFEGEYKHFSQLIGVDYRDEFWGMFICSEDDRKAEKYSRVTKSSRIKEY